MNILKCITVLSILVFAGCQSSRTDRGKSAHGTLPDSLVTYTVESIPNSRLSATSREGDESGAVYSSNIIAVYVNNPTNNVGGINSEIIQRQK